MKLLVKRTGMLFLSGLMLFTVAVVILGLTGCKDEAVITPDIKVAGEPVFDATGGTNTITINANYCNWQIVSQSDWLSFSTESGIGSAKVKLTAAENFRTQDREGAIEVRFEGGSIPVKVSQKGFILLNGDATANSYIVNSGAGVYGIKAEYKGNSLTEGVGDWASALLLWQDKKGLVTKISANPKEKLILINISDNPGNAVVCVKDDNRNTLWSWHLWVVKDFDPSAKAFTTPEEYGNGTRWTFMDRHLGATVATPGSTEAFGLIYQWGRKDPFTASAAITEKERKIYDIDGREIANFHSRALKDGTLLLSTLKPMTFYTVSYATGDWRNVSNDDLWGGISMKKTIHDPCPAGWKVPVSNAAGNTPYGFLNRNNTTWKDNGRLFNGSDWWLAASGTRVLETGELNIDALGEPYGGVWTGTHGKANTDPEYPALYGQYMFVGSGRLVSVGKDTRSQGMSVRCVKE